MKPLLLLIFLLLNVKSYSAEPIIDVAKLPSDAVLEAYEENDALFTLAVLRYYENAVILKTQLELLGESVRQKIQPPSYEALNDLELDLIIKYYRIAKQLEQQVKESDEISINENIINLKKQIKLEKISKIDTLWQLTNSFLERELELINKRDSICYEQILGIQEKINDDCQNCVNYLSLSISENIFFTGNDNIISNPNLGVKISINGEKLMGFGKFFEFWYQYQAPRFKTKEIIYSEELENSWNVNMNALGISTLFNPILDVDGFSSGLKVGLGYFWMQGSKYNIYPSDLYWEGLELNIDYIGGVSSSSLPFEIIAGIKVLHSFSDPLSFNTAGPLIESEKTLITINLGIQYNFWSSSY